MLAYVFWHRPRDPAATEPYEHALIAFHRSLARSLPVGTRASATFRVAELPWLALGSDAASAAVAEELGEEPGAREAVGYEDWYLVEDFAALGVLNEAAVGRGHLTSHDEIAHRFGAGAGGLYALLEGEPCAAAFAEAVTAVWISRPLGRATGTKRRDLVELLGDGMAPTHASLWCRQLVFGPAPDLCLLAAEVPCGVAAARLPDGWSATVLEREVLWSG
jgi:hypothetical protein